ncbi:hypothetical protein AAFN47_19960 [Hoeflea sp. CAU 1731]
MADKGDFSKKARRDLDKLRDEGGLLNAPKLESKTKSVRGHFTASDADQTDPIEVWGTRIGRWLAVVVFIALAIWLFNFFGQNG